MDDIKLMSQDELKTLVLGEELPDTKEEGQDEPSPPETSKSDSDSTGQSAANPEKVENEPQKKPEFVFDREKFIADGIKDEAALTVIERQQKEIWEKERFIGKQSNDVGSLRKTVDDFKSKIQELEIQKSEIAKNKISKEEYDDISLTSPFEAAQKLKESHENEAKVNQIAQEQFKIATAIRNYELVPDLDSKVDGIAQVMKSDGVPDELVSEFKANYRSFFKPEMTFALSKRAEALQDRAKLESQIEEYKNKTKQNVDRLKGLHQNNPTAGVPKATTGTAKDLTKTDPKFMTLDELKELVNG